MIVGLSIVLLHCLLLDSCDIMCYNKLNNVYTTDCGF